MLPFEPLKEASYWISCEKMVTKECKEMYNCISLVHSAVTNESSILQVHCSLIQFRTSIICHCLLVESSLLFLMCDDIKGYTIHE